MNRNDTQNLRILFITPSMGIGGTGRQLFELSTSLQNLDHEVKIISLTPVGNFGNMARSRGIPVVSLNITHKASFPLAIWRLRQEIKSFSPDVLHGHLYHGIIVGRVSSIGLPITTISTIHNIHHQNPETKNQRDNTTLRDYVYRFTDLFTDVTTFVSDSSMERYVSSGAVPKRKATRVYNGIDLSEFDINEEYRSSSEEFIWVTVGSLEKRKDHQTLLAAIDILRNAEDNFEVWIIGDGELRKELEKLTTELGVEDLVKFLGEKYDIPKYLNMADSFVLSSQWEGFGLVVAEAMACELPVVVTDAGGPSELILDKQTGLLVSPGSPNALANAMEKMMETPEDERRLYGKNGRKRIEDHFSIEKITENWVQTYNRFLKE